MPYCGHPMKTVVAVTKNSITWFCKDCGKTWTE